MPTTTAATNVASAANVDTAASELETLAKVKAWLLRVAKWFPILNLFAFLIIAPADLDNVLEQVSRQCDALLLPAINECVP